MSQTLNKIIQKAQEHLNDSNPKIFFKLLDEISKTCEKILNKYDNHIYEKEITFIKDEMTKIRHLHQDKKKQYKRFKEIVSISETLKERIKLDLENYEKTLKIYKETQKEYKKIA